MQCAHMEQAPHPPLGAGLHDFLRQLGMLSLESFARMTFLVEDANKVDDGISVLEPGPQEGAIVHVAFHEPHGGQHQQIAESLAVAREEDDIMPSFGQARGKASPDKAGSSQKTDFMRNHGRDDLNLSLSSNVLKATSMGQNAESRRHGIDKTAA